MTDHTIEAHFQVSALSSTPREDRIVHAMALAVGGNRIDAYHMAGRLYRAIKAMREAELKEEVGEGKT
jgi:hypothetical protein